MMVDAQNVLTLVQNLISSKLTRHITRRELVVRDREAAEELVVTKVRTNDNLADMLTKSLDPTPYSKLRRELMNLKVRSVSCPRPKRRGQA